MLIKKHKLNQQSNDEELNEARLSFEEPVQSKTSSDVELSFEDEEQVKQKTEEMIAQQKQRLEAQEAQLMAEVKAQAEQLLADAQNQAQEILADVNNQKEEFEANMQSQNAELEEKQAQLTEIIAAEKQKALEEALNEGQAYVTELKKILGSFQDAKESLLEEAHSEILSLAMDVAKQILKKEVSLSPEILETQVSSAIAKVVKGKGKVQVIVNPDDKALLDDIRESLEATLEANVQLIFASEDSIDKGSCVIETKGGRFDASFSTQLKVIEQAFKGYVNHEIKDLGKTTEKKRKKKKKVDIPEQNQGNKNEEVDTQKQAKTMTDEPTLEEMQALEGNMDELFSEMDDISEGALDEILSEALAGDADAKEQEFNQDMPISDEDMSEEEDEEDDEDEFEDSLEAEMLEDEHFIEEEDDEESDNDEDEEIDYISADSETDDFDTVSEESFDESLDERFPEY